jgi:hypothetical protein
LLLALALMLVVVVVVLLLPAGAAVSAALVVKCFKMSGTRELYPPPTHTHHRLIVTPLHRLIVSRNCNNPPLLLQHQTLSLLDSPCIASSSRRPLQAVMDLIR